ncbi:MAG: PQQ-binding-like beta-propeller repeat protein [Candidatus Bathyarchaeota archaeon]|nr:PQQ-binding-like beta-propeller repeat protein [Candidatus Bathyarchaeum sp.]
MKTKKNKTTASILTTIVTLAILCTSLAFPIVLAHDPSIDVPTYAYVTISPDTVSVGQTAFVLMWLNWPPPSAAGVGGDRWTGYTLEVTKPNGDIETLGPFMSDATSSTWHLFTPDQLGEYTFVFNFPGQEASLYHPVTGIEGDLRYGDYIGDYFLPSSATATLTVQEEPIEEPQTYPLPTEYWTRPIEGQNTAWTSIASNYLNPFGAAYRTGSQRFQYGDAPDSPHIIWTKPLEDGGIVGVEYSIPSVSYYTGLSYESRFNTPLIINGRLYYDAPLSNNAKDGPYTCVDLLTGEVLWENDEISPTFGQLYLYESFNQHGVITNGYLWQTSSNRWDAYDSLTGEWLFALTDVPSGTNVYGSNGEITRYIFDYEANTLGLWTNEALPDSPLVRTPGTSSNAYQYRPIGKEANMSQNYAWTVTIPDLPEDSTIIAAIPDDLVLGATPTIPSGARFGTEDPVTVWAISLNPETRGQLLWMKDYSAPEGFLTRLMGPVDAETRVFTMNDKETMQWLGYDLDSGDLLWGPVGQTRALNYYPTIGMGSSGQAGFVAYGNLYVGGYGGEFFCYDLTDGTLNWKYDNTFSGTQTPWGNYPIFPAAICDGKVYLYSGEHSPNAPMYQDSLVRCIDAFTGDELWTMMSWGAVGSFADEGWPIADGHIVYLNAYDNQLYCIGKGPSETTVTVQDDIVSDGDSVLIKGRVTDISAGTTQNEQAARFPNGVPAVSDESMSDWMEYLYMQKPCPVDLTGVEVTLSAIDPNGNFQDIGTVTADGYGMFKKMWTPPVEGEYIIYATFEGSNSYWPSFDETALGVTQAASASTPIEPETPDTETPDTETPDTETPDTEAPDTEEPTAQTALISTEVAILVVVAVAVVVGVAAFWTLRKRK